jgi:hypothetical protein
MSRPWTVDRLTEASWQVLELAKHGLPLDHDIQGDRIRWGGRLQIILNLRHHGLLDAENKITRAGLDAFVPRPVTRRPDNRNRYRRDKCFTCPSRSCYLRIYSSRGEFDEVACTEHESALREHVAQLDNGDMITEASEFKLKCAPKTKKPRVWYPPE